MPVIDNVSSSVREKLDTDSVRGLRIRVASAVFSLFAFDVFRDELLAVGEFSFLWSTPAFSKFKDADAASEFIRLREVGAGASVAAIAGTEFEVHLKNSLRQQVIARECVEWIRSSGATFKSYRGEAPLTPMLSVGAQQTFSPVAGFSASALGGVESPQPFVSGVFGPSESVQFLKYFDAVWANPKLAVDVTDQVVEVLEKLFAVNSPAFVYFVMLYSIFSEFLESLDEDFLPNDLTGFKQTQIWKSLFNFQRDAAAGLINRLERFNGCILADSVGLGKTYTALAVVKYYELRNKRVLVLAPKKLMSNWTMFNSNVKTNPLNDDQFRFDVLAHTDLGRTSGFSGSIDLSVLEWGNYDLVVIDESHNFRNVGTGSARETRYQKLMNQVVKAGVKTKLLMLSATPVNNRFTDLKNQLDLAYQGDSELLAEHLGLESTLDGVFRQAQKSFNRWSELDAEKRTPAAILKMLNFDFFEVLDAVTIARSRKQIQRNYDTASVGAFPERNAPKSLRMPLTYLEDVPSFTEVNDELMKLNLAVYTPLAYVHRSALIKYEDSESHKNLSGTARNVNAQGREAGLKKLMAVNLLKRLESSVEAFRITLSGLTDKIEKSLSAVEIFRASSSRVPGLIDIDAEDTDWDTEDELEAATAVGGKFAIQLSDMDVATWEADLRRDLGILQGLQARIDAITVDHDAKLQQLLAHILEKVSNPLNAGNRKMLIFSAFADTAEYLYRELHPRLQRVGLQSALITGSAGARSTLQEAKSFEQVLMLFSPLSKNRDKVMPDVEGEIDILFATDCISEGQNLQDCDWLVNYDIHWNPVRIIQRFGRVDRIGSQNSRIQLVNFWPDVELDEYLNIKDRVEGRMVIANMAGTGDDNVLLAPSTDKSADSDHDYRKRQLQRLQEEVLDLEDSETGISITDLGLNDYRTDLQNLVQQFGALNVVPTGIHAAVPAKAKVGLVPGAIFLVRETGQATGDRGNRLHPHILVYVGEDGVPVTDFLDPKQALGLLRISCLNEVEPIDAAVAAFNRQTVNGTDMSLYRGLLESALKSVDTAAGEGVVHDLFSGTLASLSGELTGSDRFEVLAFLAVVDC